MDWRDDGKDVTITHTQDVQPVLDLAHSLAMDEDRTRKGIKQDQWHYAKLPSTVILEMKQKHGVDLMAKKVDWPSVFKIINDHYPRFKTTHLTHNTKQE